MTWLLGLILTMRFVPRSCGQCPISQFSIAHRRLDPHTVLEPSNLQNKRANNSKSARYVGQIIHRREVEVGIGAFKRDSSAAVAALGLESEWRDPLATPLHPWVIFSGGAHKVDTPPTYVPSYRLRLRHLADLSSPPNSTRSIFHIIF